MKTRKLGEILVERGLVSEADLVRLLENERSKGQPLGTLLVQQGLITEEDLLEALSEQLGLPFWRKLEEVGIEHIPVSKIPIAFYRQQKVFPIAFTDGGLKVAVSDPLNLQPLDDLAVFLGAPVEPVISSERELMAAINRYFDRETGSTEQVMQDIEGEDLGAIANEIEETDDLLDLASEAPVIRLVNSILTQAVRARASDVHIEPFERELKVRYRIDGLLYNTLTPPRRLQAAISSRIKVMANLNIAERRLPQDGRIRIRVGEKDVDIRVSVVPTAYGERIVLRLLDKTSVLLGLEEIGMGEEAYVRYSRLIKRSNGIILVTGPTGSGKTTTLYGTLNKINAPELNIITIEDPIEYQLNGIGQIQVNPRIDLTFANGLRSILRQDPDIIMVGEIRDRETAEIAIQASLTGHLVFSTLHTNDAAGAVTRLLDMGVEAFLVSSSVLAIIAQRLVRVICKECREPYRPDTSLVKEMGLDRASDPLFEGFFYRGKGCAACFQTGYRGRSGIYELLAIDDNIRSLIMSGADSSVIRRKAIEQGMTTLFRDGVIKVIKGTTTVDEVLRVTQE
ncbi:MAG: type II secretion system ATPase GspE [Candidatus Tectomicrobia bacterium]|nr:type II secretion system ATPase GspE [Candidatus Tectomicrobia bacterium]